MCNVPTKYYPWVLMVAIQVIMPNISLLGHLCGAVMGFLHVHGHLRWIMPSQDAAKALETWGCLQCIVRRPNFVLGPDALPKPDGESNACVLLGGCVGFLWRGVRPLTVCAWNASVGHLRPAWRMGTSADGSGPDASSPAATPSGPRYISDQGIAMTSSSPSPCTTASASVSAAAAPALPAHDVGVGPRADVLGDVELAPAGRFGLGRPSTATKPKNHIAGSEQEQEPLMAAAASGGSPFAEDADLLQLGSGSQHATDAPAGQAAAEMDPIAAAQRAGGMQLGGKPVTPGPSSGTRARDRSAGRLAHSRLLSGKK